MKIRLKDRYSFETVILGLDNIWHVQSIQGFKYVNCILLSTTNVSSLYQGDNIVYGFKR